MSVARQGAAGGAAAAGALAAPGCLARQSRLAKAGPSPASVHDVTARGGPTNAGSASTAATTAMAILVIDPPEGTRGPCAARAGHRRRPSPATAPDRDPAGTRP